MNWQALHDRFLWTRIGHYFQGIDAASVEKPRCQSKFRDDPKEKDTSENNEMKEDYVSGLLQWRKFQRSLRTSHQGAPVNPDQVVCLDLRYFHCRFDVEGEIVKMLCCRDRHFDEENFKMETMI